ncbi:MAG: 5-formyltetrahydrofolate cycloligase [Pseudomonadota bacterium]|jgi:5-formyltetrahydrofolate cyclo-ligase
MQRMSKEIFRIKCKALLKDAAKRRYALDKKWLKNITAILKSYKNILMFLSMPIEPNTKPLINWARKKNKNIFVPLTLNRSFKMVPYRLPLKNGQFNIKTCGNSLKLNSKIDLAVVPILGIDGTFRRIGFGKGFYDRFFGSLKQKPKIVFTQRILTLSKQLVTKDYDTKADCIVTSQGFFYKGQVKGVDRIISYRNSNSRHRISDCKKDGCVQIRHFHRASKV